MSLTGSPRGRGIESLRAVIPRDRATGDIVRSSHLLVLWTLLGACRSHLPAPAPDAASSWEVTVDDARSHLIDLQSALPPPAPNGTWTADQDTNTFTMLNGDGEPYVTASFAVVGTYSTEDNAWAWAWATDGIDNDPRLEVVRRHGEQAGLPMLTTDLVAGTKTDGEDLWAVALQIAEAEGWYRFQMSPTTWAYMALYDIHTADVSAQN